MVLVFIGSCTWILNKQILCHAYFTTVVEIPFYIRVHLIQMKMDFALLDLVPLFLHLGQLLTSCSLAFIKDVLRTFLVWKIMVHRPLSWPCRLQYKHWRFFSTWHGASPVRPTMPARSHFVIVLLADCTVNSAFLALKLERNLRVELRWVSLSLILPNGRQKTIQMSLKLQQNLL